MRLLVKNATILDTKSPYHEQVVDLFIDNGVIQKIGKTLSPQNAQIIEQKGLYVSVGWMDVGVEVCDPGLEHRENLESIAAAASAGGYTGIICHPNTKPVVHSKSGVLYIKNNSAHLPVDFYPTGAVSENCQGLEITEMIDMHYAGAVAFSDGKKPIQNNGMMMRALQYVKTFDGLVINHPHDKSVATSGQVNEGFVSTILGLKGISHLSEDIMVQRDIYLAEYTDSKLHINNISTATAVDLIRKAKQKNIQVTASVAALNLVYTDDAVKDFNANFKVLPPLRTQQDVDALRAGIVDGTIDFINTNHTPWHSEAKNLEFLYAEFGAIGLESTFGLLRNHLAETIDLPQLIEMLTVKNRQIFNLPIPKIATNEKANLTIFQPHKQWIFSPKDLKSKSKNSPLIGTTMLGKVIATVNNNLANL